MITVVCMGLPVQVPARTMVESGPTGSLTLRSLILTRLASQHGSGLIDALFDGEDLKPGYVILVNGRNAVQLGGLEVVVEDGATVVVTPVVSGG
jgi:molybdopterin converting factor small subunit